MPGLIGQDYSLHYPVGKSLFGDSLSLLLSSEADKELVWGPEALRTVHVRDKAVQWLDLPPPPGAAIASSPPDP